eukprot:TRINITY_DN2821_c0_g2_i2.p1 TRINITY_DN2821_c0_g2~~TRINITY_DN2821_c0_g2_i2.p1  ORF type:complete len:233 (-),score=25.53 TRINITY_DN2821_c0_g2_i2:174-872(-)
MSTRPHSPPSPQLSTHSQSLSTNDSIFQMTFRYLYSWLGSISPLGEKELRLPGKRKTLVLDLDETLVHSTVTNEDGHDFQVEVCINGTYSVFYVFKRPHVDYFLEKVSEWYDIIIFTASMKQYAEPVINKLDPKGLTKGRYFRESCLERKGLLIKDFRIPGFDTTTTIIIDNSPVSYSMNKENAIPIDNYIGSATGKGDQALLNILPILDALRYTEDVRSILRLGVKKAEGR